MKHIVLVTGNDRKLGLAMIPKITFGINLASGLKYNYHSN